MEPTYERLDAFCVLGLQERFGHEDDDYTGVWQRYMTYHDGIAPHSVDGAFYGCSFSCEDPEAMDYLAGMRVAETAAPTQGLTLRAVPASEYAVFACKVSEIPAAFQRIFREWLPASGRRAASADSPKASFERYPPDTTSGDDLVRLYIALEGDG